MLLLLFFLNTWSNDIYIYKGYTSYPNQKNIVCDKNGGVHISWLWWNIAQFYFAGYEYYNGTDWTNGETVSEGIGSGVLTANPSIAVDKNLGIYSIWQANYKYSDIILRISSAGVWQDTGIFISSEPNYYNYTPSIACDSTGVIHIVWQKRYDVYYRKLIGNNLSSGLNLSNSGIYAAYPSIEVYGNKLFVVWEDLRDGNFEIYLKEFDGAIWQNAVRITNSTEASLFPSFCIDNTGKLHIVWQEEQEGKGYKIFYTSFFNGNPGTIDTLVNSPGEAISPSIVTKGNKLWVTWSDSRDGDWEIYYKEYNGTMWKEDTRLTFVTGNSANPKIAVDNSENLYLLFWDTKDDTAKVYFKENIVSKDNPFARQDTLLISPNPFTSKTVIRYSLNGSRLGGNTVNDLRFTIYDLAGRLVKSFLINQLPNNQVTTIEWDGKNTNGKLLNSGMYFLKYSNTVRKIVFIR